MSRVLVLGGSGMLGHAVWRTCAERFDAYASVRSDELSGAAAEALDPDRTVTGVRIEEPLSVARALDETRPDAVVDCIGVVKQAVDDPTVAIRANALFPHELGLACRERGARLVHVSTDCVFSGRKGGYEESDRPDPEDLYGRSKLLGELATPGSLTIRTSMIGRELATSHGLLEWFLAQAGGSVRGFTRAVFSGPTTPVLSRAIADVIERQDELGGLWHLSASPIAKHDLLLLLRDAFELDVEIEPDDSVVIDRSLDSTRFRSATGWVPPSWPEMVDELAATADHYAHVRQDLLDGKRVIVTGGTGSLGQVLARRLLEGELGVPEEVVVFSRSEALQHTMRLAFQHRRVATDDIVYDEERHQRLHFRIGDIRDYAAVTALLRGADVVFHAAAMKQVPTCEYHPVEAFMTNAMGAQNIARAISEHRLDVEAVVGISTDKACKPVNVMGMTKALQERILLEANLQASDTRFIVARYGNVLASRGSVIPVFCEQIEHGGPVTVTTPEMTRFLLSLDEAVDTVFAALRSALPGETYVPRVPTARVVDVARALIGDRDIEIEYMGIRPGEKTHEVLVSEEEAPRTYDRGEYLAIQPILPELRPDEVEGQPFEGREYSSADDLADADAVRALLERHRMLPGAQPQPTR